MLHCAGGGIGLDGRQGQGTKPLGTSAVKYSPHARGARQCRSIRPALGTPAFFAPLASVAVKPVGGPGAEDMGSKSMGLPSGPELTYILS